MPRRWENSTGRGLCLHPPGLRYPPRRARPHAARRELQQRDVAAVLRRSSARGPLDCREILCTPLSLLTKIGIPNKAGGWVQLDGVVLLCNYSVTLNGAPKRYGVPLYEDAGPSLVEAGTVRLWARTPGARAAGRGEGLECSATPTVLGLPPVGRHRLAPVPPVARHLSTTSQRTVDGARLSPGVADVSLLVWSSTDEA